MINNDDHEWRVNFICISALIIIVEPDLYLTD